MKGKDVTIADVVDAFMRRGFQYIDKSTDGWFRLHGRLAPAATTASYACEIMLDPQFSELPLIRLLETPATLPPVTPHLGSDGHLCYIAKGTVVIDIFDPIGQFLACLERAEFVLGEILTGKFVEDLEEEFYAYWGGGFCLVDVQSKNLGKQRSMVAKINDSLTAVVTDDAARTSQKLKSFGYDVSEKTYPTYRVRTAARPRPSTEQWPPNTVKDILAWQSYLDPRCRRKIEQRIQEGYSSRAGGALVLVESPTMTYGFIVLFERNATKKTKGTLADRNRRIYGLKVVPMTVVRIDDRYITERNIPGSKTLAAKKIAVVGCGTIGGYLAEMLVKAGAGTCDGQLTLLDPDTLYPQNVGRHRLGFPSLFSNKAAAMANELVRLAPGVNIRPLPVDVKEAHLGEIDLLIDATGEEGLGHWLCKHYLSSVPMISVWIEGPGSAVRALLRANSAGACYRCLWQSNRKGKLCALVGSTPIVLAGHGCEGLYVPFPASVSVQAAGLGAEMVLDWANEILSPALRTKLIDTTRQLATPDCDPPKSTECPACSS